jgi:uncharacterized repeat protein (TIGR01451 family)
MRLLLSFIAMLGLSAAIAAPAHAASPNCATEGGTLLSWPTVDPVWEMCWIGPDASSGPRGSGMELRAVHYRGLLVAKRIHSPMLFAEYTSGTCYRDWKDDATPTLAHTSTHNQMAVPPDLGRLAQTACSVSQLPTTSYGTCPFQQPPVSGYQCTSGQDVVIEDLGDHVRLVTQYRADWYMYDSRISFFDDGAIEPVFGFGNNNGTLNSTTHWHHNYWRFDFDIDGAENNMVSINDVDQAVEFDDLRGQPGSTTWEVRNTVTERGFRLVPGADDYDVATNESGRDFHMVDLMATRYIANEYGDNPNYSLGDCGMNENALVNGANIENEDVVLWYRVAVRDSTASDWPPGCGAGGTPCIPQDSMVCKTAGPRIEPFGPWGGEPGDEADLGVAISADPSTVPAGEALTFSIEVSNAGPQDVSQATVVLDLPQDFDFVSGNGAGTWNCTAAGVQVTCELGAGSIAANGSNTLDIDVTVAEGAELGVTAAVVTVTSDEWTDPVSANDSADVEITVGPSLLDLIFPSGFECAPGRPGCN